MKIVKEEESIPVNQMGTSSSVPGTDGIDTFDPLINKNKKSLKDILNKSKKRKK